MRRLVLAFLLFSVPAMAATTQRTQLVYKSGLTDAASNDIFEVALAAGERTAGEIHGVIVASDGADYQVRWFDATWTAENKAGAIVTGLVWDSPNESLSAGTLTINAITSTAGASKITIAIDLTSSLVPTTLFVDLELEQHTSQGVTRK